MGWFIAMSVLLIGAFLMQMGVLSSVIEENWTDVALYSLGALVLSCSATVAALNLSGALS